MPFDKPQSLDLLYSAWGFTCRWGSRSSSRNPCSKQKLSSFCITVWSAETVALHSGPFAAPAVEKMVSRPLLRWISSWIIAECRCKMAAPHSLIAIDVSNSGVAAGDKNLDMTSHQVGQVSAGIRKNCTIRTTKSIQKWNLNPGGRF